MRRKYDIRCKTNVINLDFIDPMEGINRFNVFHCDSNVSAEKNKKKSQLNILSASLVFIHNIRIDEKVVFVVLSKLSHRTK